MQSDAAADGSGSHPGPAPPSPPLVAPGPPQGDAAAPSRAAPPGPRAPGGALVVRGGARLSGHVRVSGAKNAALAALAASLLASGPVALGAVPDLTDVSEMCAILSGLGVAVSRDPSGTVHLSPPPAPSSRPCAQRSRRLRASFLVLGPLVARAGRADVPLPGGCAIGRRPVDLHLEALEALGATVRLREAEGRVEVAAPPGGLRGGAVALRFPSVGATETAVMAASLAAGTTTITNAAREPEVEDLVRLLSAMGARVESLEGGATLVVRGVPSLGGARHEVIPDRIEAGTFMAAAAATRSAITVGPVVPGHVAPVVGALRQMGAVVTEGAELRGVEVETQPFPGFPTDMQPLLMAVLVSCAGASRVTETVFEDRMRHVEELARMGARVEVSDCGRVATVRGGGPLRGAAVRGPDLRAGAGLVVAGLAAEGTTVVGGLEHLDRGYDGLVDKLRGLGANVTRVPEGLAPHAAGGLLS